MANKVLETYKMVAELLNSGSESNIEKAYAALLSATEEKYQSRLSDIASDYADKRDTAARNKAMSDRYLNYFMTERGYGGSGIEADAKMKSELSYRSGLSALSGDEIKAKDAARQSRDEEAAKLESQKHKDQTAYEDKLYDRIYQAGKDEADEAYRQKQLELQAAEEAYRQKQAELDEAYRQKQLELQEQAAQRDAYWKEKDYELEKEKISKSTEAAVSKTYQSTLYDYFADSIKEAKTEADLEKIFMTLTGKWKSQAAEMLGESNYNKLIKSVRGRMGEMAAADADKEKVQVLYNAFKSAKDENIYDVYLRLERRIKDNEELVFTLNQLKTAYNRYVAEQREAQS